MSFPLLLLKDLASKIGYRMLLESVSDLLKVEAGRERDKGNMTEWNRIMNISVGIDSIIRGLSADCGKVADGL